MKTGKQIHQVGNRFQYQITTVHVLIVFHYYYSSVGQRRMKEGSNEGGQTSKEYEVIRPTEKECLNHHLLHTVKQVNGDVAFKQVYQKSLVIRFHQRMPLPEQYANDYFCYILQGEVSVYKILRNKQEDRQCQQRNKSQLNNAKGIFITSHKAHEIFGLQEYPLNITEKLVFEANQITKIMVFPLDLSLTSFKRIFNMNMVQFRAEAMKKCEFFRQFQIEKLKKMALYSKRYTGQKGQFLIKEGNPLNYLVLMLSGQILSLSKGKQQKIYGSDSAIGLEEVLDGTNESYPSDLVCINQCEFMLIPKDFIIKSYKIRYRLQDKQSVCIKSRRRTQYEQEKEKYSSLKLKPKEARNTVGIQSDTVEMPLSQYKLRPSTSVYGRASHSVKDVKYSTFYSQKKEILTSKRHRTEFSQKSQKVHLRTDYSRNESIGLEYKSLGQLCLKKFINRKERRENCQIMKYLKSNAPELKLNPSKQFAVVKPMLVSDSTYIRTWKRKLKKSYLKTGGPQQRENKQKQAKFSLFFKQDAEEDELN